ncbi:aminotransferase [Sneathiella limimaris]|uniref:aminotransferase n=1 Tax=Sneathiella limimaris TaxID=1964213 RepID=UPI00146E8567|nr:aminotransferase [Sneathiella limimaris]
MTSAAFNPLIDTLSLPPIPLVQKWAKAYDGSRGKLLDLAQAVPGYPPAPEMLTWLKETAGDASYTGYGPIEGDLDLREAYAKEVSNIYRSPIGTHQIHITSGCNQAFVAAVMTIAGAGDSILLSDPFYFNHDTTLDMLGIGVKRFALSEENNFIPRISDLEAALDPTVKAIMLVSPNNPTGAIYPAEWLEEALFLCQKKGIWMILDETYRDFLPLDQSHPHDLFAKSSWGENFIQLYSFSKSFCIPGHRLGAIIAGETAIQQIIKVMDNLQICAPRPPQGAVAKGIVELDNWRAENRNEIARRAEALKEALRPLEKWHVASIGAYFSYIKHDFDGVSSEVIAEKLGREYGVSCLPGTFFGNGQDSYLRFAFANIDPASIHLLTERLKGFTLTS